MARRTTISRATLVVLALAWVLPREAIAQAPPYLLQWGTPGSGNGQFKGPSGIAVDAGHNVYVVDRENQRIQKFTSSGVYLAQWGHFGSGDGEFQFPFGVAV